MYFEWNRKAKNIDQYDALSYPHSNINMFICVQVKPECCNRRYSTGYTLVLQFPYSLQYWVQTCIYSVQMNVRVCLSSSLSAPSLKYTNALYRRRKAFLFFVKQTLLSVCLPAIAFPVRLISLSVVPFSHLSFYLSLSVLRMYVQKLTAACSPSSMLYNL